MRAEILGNRFGAGTDVKFFVDVAHVCVNGQIRDGESVSDFLVQVAFGEQVEDFPFARGQRLGGRLIRSGLMEGLNDFSSDVARHCSRTANVG